MKIILKNLVFKGKHGVKKEEKKKVQKFEVGVFVKTIKNKQIGDKLDESVDYRNYKEIVRREVEGKSYSLLESLCSAIAEKILENREVFCVDVRIKKPDVWDNGVPEVRTKLYNHPKVNLLDFDLNKVLDELLSSGATSFPIIPNERLQRLKEEAEKYEYKRQPEVVGKQKVREELSSFDKFEEGSLFKKFQEDFIDLLNYKLALSKLKPFGTTPVSFNEGVLQKYEKGSIGITPHMDGLSCINLVLVFVIKGKGDFFLCDDREKTNSRMLETLPGHVVILRAPGFFGSSRRPFHYLTNITEERITFGLRQNTRLFKR